MKKCPGDWDRRSEIGKSCLSAERDKFGPSSWSMGLSRANWALSRLWCSFEGTLFHENHSKCAVCLQTTSVPAQQSCRMQRQFALLIIIFWVGSILTVCSNGHANGLWRFANRVSRAEQQAVGLDICLLLFAAFVWSISKHSAQIGTILCCFERYKRSKQMKREQVTTTKRTQTTTLAIWYYFIIIAGNIASKRNQTDPTAAWNSRERQQLASNGASLGSLVCRIALVSRPMLVNGNMK